MNLADLVRSAREIASCPARPACAGVPPLGRIALVDLRALPVGLLAGYGYATWWTLGDGHAGDRRLFPATPDGLADAAADFRDRVARERANGAPLGEELVA